MRQFLSLRLQCSVTLVLLVLSENLIEDWVRDALDPRARGTRRPRSAGALNPPAEDATRDLRHVG